jgi:hypothetical protein
MMSLKMDTLASARCADSQINENNQDTRRERNMKSLRLDRLLEKT